MVEMRATYGAERRIRQELVKAELEKRELLELLKDLQPIRAKLPGQQAPREPGGQDNEPSRQLQKGAWTHASGLLLQSAQATNMANRAPSPPLGDGSRKVGSRSLSVDYTKRKSREVTVI